MKTLKKNHILSDIKLFFKLPFQLYEIANFFSLRTLIQDLLIYLND